MSLTREEIEKLYNGGAVEQAPLSRETVAQFYGGVEQTSPSSSSSNQKKKTIPTLEKKEERKWSYAETTPIKSSVEHRTKATYMGGPKDGTSDKAEIQKRAVNSKMNEYDRGIAKREVASNPQDEQLAKDYSVKRNSLYENTDAREWMKQVLTSNNAQYSSNSTYDKQRLETLKRHASEFGIDPNEVDANGAEFLEMLRKDMATERAEKSREFGQKHKVLGTLGSVGANVGASVESLGNIATGLMGKDVNDYNRPFAETRNALREGASSDFGKVGKTAYNLGTGLMDMGANLGLAVASGGGAAVSGVLSGLNAAGNTQEMALDNGSSNRRSALTGLGVGLVEGALNTGVDDAILKNAKGQFLSKAGNSLASQMALGATLEGAENYVSDLSRIGLDYAINNDNSEVSIAYKNYLNSGMTDEQARLQLVKDYGKQFGANALMGAAMGGVMAGAVGGLSKRATRNATQNTDDIDQLVNRANNQQNEALQNLQNLNDTLEAQRVANEQAEVATRNAEAQNVVENALRDQLEADVQQANNVTNQTDTATEAQQMEQVTTDNANVPKKEYSDEIAKDSVFSKLDKQFNKILGWYAQSDGNTSNEFDEEIKQVRRLLNQTIEEGDLTAYEEAWKIIYEIDAQLQGRKHTMPSKLKANGSLRRKGTTYTYGKDASLVGDMEAAHDQFIEYFQNNLMDKYLARRNANNIQDTSSVDTVSSGDMKVSKTRTNTMENDQFTTDTEKTQYAPEALFEYEVQHNSDSLNRATERVSQDSIKAREEVMNRTGETMSAVDVDTAMILYRQRLEEARAIEAQGGDYVPVFEDAMSIFKKIQEISSKNGQAIQALAKWSKHTPEGMLAQAERMINGKIANMDSKTLDALGLDYTRQVIKGNNKNNVTLDAEFQKEFLDLGKQLEKLTDNESPEAKKIIGRMAKMVDDKIPSTVPEKIRTVLMDNMLGNFRTLISRNALGNLGLNTLEQTVTKATAAGIDKVLSLKTKKRTVAVPTLSSLKDYGNGFAKGTKTAVHNLVSNEKVTRTGDNSLQSAINRNRHVFSPERSKTKIGKAINTVADKLDGLVKSGLEAGDLGYYEGTYKQTYGDLYRMRKKGILGDDVMAKSDADFEIYAQDVAKQRALEAVYQDKSKLAEGMTDIKNGIGKVSKDLIGTDVLTQFSMPFVTTPANVLKRGVEYSPFGIAKNAWNTRREIKSGNFDQQRFATETARNIVGAGIVGAGAAMKANDLMSGSFSDDSDMKNAQKEIGMQEYALRMGDDGYYDIGWAPVAGSGLVAGAAIMDAVEKNREDGIIPALNAGIMEGFDSTVNMSALQGLRNLFGANSYSSGSLGENIKDVLVSGATQAIPSLSRQIAQVSDTNERNVYNSERDSNLNSAINMIPGLRQDMLEEKIDTLGNPVLQNQGRGTLSKIFENMLSPGKYTTEQHSAVRDEAMRLFDTTGENKVFIPPANRKDDWKYSKTVDGEKVDVQLEPTDEEFRLYSEEKGKLTDEIATATIQSDFYASLPEEDKANIMSEVYSTAKAIARMRNVKVTTKDNKVEGYTTDSKLVEAYEQGGVNAVLAKLEKDYVLDSADASKNSVPIDNAYAKYGKKGVETQKAYTDYMKKNKNRYEGKGASKHLALDFVNENIKSKGDAGWYLYNNAKGGKTIDSVYNEKGYSGVYDYYTNFVAADKNENGSIDKKKELIPYLNSKYQSVEDKRYWFDKLKATPNTKNPY